MLAGSHSVCLLVNYTVKCVASWSDFSTSCYFPKKEVILSWCFYKKILVQRSWDLGHRKEMKPKMPAWPTSSEFLLYSWLQSHSQLSSNLWIHISTSLKAFISSWWNSLFATLQLILLKFCTFIAETADRWTSPLGQERWWMRRVNTHLFHKNHKRIHILWLYDSSAKNLT